MKKLQLKMIFKVSNSIMREILTGIVKDQCCFPQLFFCKTFCQYGKRISHALRFGHEHDTCWT